MKLSEYKKKFDHENPDAKLRCICIDDFLKITIFDNQPERSKREDLNYCKLSEELDQVITNVHWEHAPSNEPEYENCDDSDCVFLNYLLQEFKMRCSEHCGNTVREVQEASPID